MIEQSEAGVFVHKFTTGRGSPYTLLLLHGTGGDEMAMIPIGRALAPSASLLSPRGPVREGGAARFFKFPANGVFDVEDVATNTHQLADFVKMASGAYGFDATKIIPVGYSNGANIAASLLLLRAEHFPAAVLFRPMVIFEPETVPDLSDTAVYISAGNLDPLIAEENTQELASLFRTARARVTLSIENATHALVKHEIAAAGKWLAERLGK